MGEIWKKQRTKRAIIKEYFKYQRDAEKEYGPDVVVVMELGRFYEIYAVSNSTMKIGNIEKIESITGLKIKYKSRTYEENTEEFPLNCGFPTASLEVRFGRLLMEGGFTIVIVNQVTPAPKCKRRITKVLSEGTYVGREHPTNAHFIIGIYVERCKSLTPPRNPYRLATNLAMGMCVIDLGTGESYVYECYGNENDTELPLDELQRFISSYHPREALIYSAESVSPTDISKLKELLKSQHGFITLHFKSSALDPKKLRADYQEEVLGSIFKERVGLLSPLEYAGLDNYQFAAISYICILEFARQHDEKVLVDLPRPILYMSDDKLLLEGNTVTQLDLIKFAESSYVTSLECIINKTVTAPGKRAFRRRLLNPITDIDELNARYDSIETLRNGEDVDGSLINHVFIARELRGVPDLVRFSRRMALKTLVPSNYVRMVDACRTILILIKKLRRVKSLQHIVISSSCAKSLKKFLRISSEFFNFEEMKRHTEITNSWDHKNEESKLGSFFKLDAPGTRSLAVLDRSVRKCRIFLDGLAERCSRIIDPDGDENCVKVEHTINHGYHIKCTKARGVHLTTNLRGEGIRFTPITGGSMAQSVQVNEKRRRLATDLDKLMPKLAKKYRKLIGQLGIEFRDTFIELCRFIEKIDILQSCANVSLQYNYCRPTIWDAPSQSGIDARELRHPIVERIHTSTEYIANDIQLGVPNRDESSNETPRGILLYGCNSVGKTVLMKSLGLGVVMAQAGMYVSASNFGYFPFTNLLTRITGTDNMALGQGSFAVEMSELKPILERASPSTLILGDEICRGTENVSGTALVCATVIELCKTKSKFMFTSHLHSLPKLDRFKRLEGVKCYHLRVRDCKGELIYERKLQDGPGKSVYGIKVARAMGLHTDFIRLANTIRREIKTPNQKDAQSIIQTKQSRYNASVYVDHCALCGSRKNLETHHISFQCTADDKGFIGHFHKHSKHNLVVVCKKCHRGIHRRRIIVSGYQQTTRGVKLKSKDNT